MRKLHSEDIQKEIETHKDNFGLLKKGWARFTKQWLLLYQFGEHNKVKNNKQSNSFSVKGSKRTVRKNYFNIYRNGQSTALEGVTFLSFRTVFKLLPQAAETAFIYRYISSKLRKQTVKCYTYKERFF